MRRTLPWLIGLVGFLVATALLAVLELLAHPVYEIPTDSMLPTLRAGSYVVIDRQRSVHDGDVVIFREPGFSRGLFVRRVLASGGETVSCSPTGVLTRNGQPVTEPYLFTDPPDSMTAFAQVTVPAGRLWVMGDHRAISVDSRFHILDSHHGTIAAHSVKGVVIQGGSAVAAYGYSLERGVVGGVLVGLSGVAITWLVRRRSDQASRTV